MAYQEFEALLTRLAREPGRCELWAETLRTGVRCGRVPEALTAATAALGAVRLRRDALLSWLAAVREAGLGFGDPRPPPRSPGRLRPALRLHRAPIVEIQVSPRGDVLATRDADERCIIWDFATGLPLASIDAGRPRAALVRVSQDGRRFVLPRRAGYEVGSFPEDDGEAGVVVHWRADPAERWSAAAFSLDGSLLLTGDDRDLVRVRDVRTGAAVWPPGNGDEPPFAGHWLREPAGVVDCGFFPGRGAFWVLRKPTLSQSAVAVFRIGHGPRPVYEFIPSGEDVRPLRIVPHPVAEYFLAVSSSKIVCKHLVPDRDARICTSEGVPEALAFDPTGTRLAIVPPGGSRVLLARFLPEEGRVGPSLPTIAAGLAPITAIAFSADGHHLCCAQGSWVRMLEAPPG